MLVYQWTPKTLLAIQLDEQNVQEDRPMEEDLYSISWSPKIGGVSEKLLLSIHAVEGRQEAETIKVIGRHKDRQLMILINTGSNNSFLDKRVAEQLKLALENMLKSIMIVGDGRKINCGHKCQKFMWVM